MSHTCSSTIRYPTANSGTEAVHQMPVYESCLLAMSHVTEAVHQMLADAAPNAVKFESCAV
jgi:hypothetical protein